MKKAISFIVTVIFSMFCMIGCNAQTQSMKEFQLKMQIDNPNMTVNGIEKEIDEGRGTTPVIAGDRTLVPIRAIIEEMGGTVNWEQDTQTVTITFSDKTITLTLNSTAAYVNGEAKTLDISPQIINERTMLPIRFISENLGYEVNWNENEQSITITNTSNNAQVSTTISPQTLDNTTSNILVAYFSCTGATEGIANYILGTIEADKYKIEEAVPYTEADLDYYSGGRADQEQADPDARPEITGSVPNMDDYDIIFLGYPIWHGQAPKIIYTFLESYDFTGKTIVPFCTSHSSGIGSSALNLHNICNGANITWNEGMRFSSSSSNSDITSWINGLNLDI